jgi:zinc finger BED domain-containing protein 5/7/8/9
MTTKRALRQYDKDFLKYGFVENDKKPQCVICGDVLANESMKPNKLQRHLATRHAPLKDKPLEFFERKKNALSAQKRLVRPPPANEKATIASMQLAYQVGRRGKPFTIVEDLVFPAMKDVVTTMIGEDAANQLDKIPRSNNTMQRRTCDIAGDLLDQLVEKLKLSPYFAIQLDESTDCANIAQLLCMVRYIDGDSLKDDMLFCRPLEGRTTAECLYAVFKATVQNLEVDWEKCIGVCSDGARAMTGKHSGFVKRLLEHAPNAKWTHCFIHRQALAAKSMGIELKAAMDTCVKAVNFIKSRATNSRLFALLCDEVGAEHRQLLLHTEVRWLSRGRVLQRLFSLRNEIHLFLTEKNEQLASYFADPQFLMKVAYLADIFGQINILNRSLQTPSMTAITANEKVLAFKKKLELWAKKCEQGNTEHFEELTEFLSREGSVKENNDLMILIVSHLGQLRSDFEDYVPEANSCYLKDHAWINNPFIVDTSDMPSVLTAKETTELIELSCAETLKAMLAAGCVPFWTAAKAEYPLLYDKAIRQLVQFATSYLCESGFSILVALKSKFRNRLLASSLEAQLRLQLSDLKPRYQKLCNAHQHHVSH